MNIIKFNDIECQVENYNKNTYLSAENQIQSNASCDLIVTDINMLNTLMQTTINNIQIYCNNDLIYDLQNIIAHVTNITEYLNNNRIYVNLSIAFSNN